LVQGYTVRVDEWRYTCWFKFDKVRIVPVTSPDGVIGRELYDHRGDPGELDWAGEHVNVVEAPEHAGLVAALHAQLLGYIRLYPVANTTAA
jgi:hypothetical protein